ncbi:zinc-binding dehydrogenase family oxidoreductase (macronuclear) [Tetrahymena thermophila SB210]|uniref:Zinc-binding dehydrogenase family oxidoreductase n=1 Tax=Tetrahymena thermophila (strain SB210) TaxID=312017 RepID=Q22RF9_TETTS|nr:zinc-binding dehydrogenase family oxidoreductase [Tetrahymena thermophila SB210]EAR88163.1 zinc-binding dehydrogenase family oxidoreductase [Tetrahymena thermophila SB210]|eukprot:XP_001008408.1 zinc-binding dehydrogenase family oxidoreductase [Tetrahymena thermophila SB210]
MEEEYNVKIVLESRPGKEYPEKDCFQITYGKPPTESEVKVDQILVRVKFISIDASMRVWISGAKTYMDPVNPGDVMPASCIGEVVFSRSPDLNKGDLVLGLMKWQKYLILDRKGLMKVPKEYPNPEHFLGVLGTNGLTAYFGMFDIGKPQKGETVVVSAAAGAVGQIAVQLAKSVGARVIGMAGSKDKCEFVKSLGADECINYKEDDIFKKLKEYCPKGIDVYFDNVGGEILDLCLLLVRDHCRIVMCGAISGYNSTKPYAIKNYQRLIIKKGLMQGFIVMDYAKRYKEAIAYLGNLISKNQLKHTEDVLYGLDSAPRGLRRLIGGDNTGKVIIKCDYPEKQQPKL